MNRDLTTSSTTRRRGQLRRRFTFVAAGTLSVLIAVLGVNFAGESATSSAGVTDKAGISVTNGTPQAWTVSVGSAGTVAAPTEAQNIATVNTTPANANSTKMLVSVYVTNLADLAVNYSSWNFNLALYDAAAPSVQLANTEQVITSDSGVVSWVLNTDKTYLLKLNEGGSYYTIANDPSGSLAPEFFVRASQL